MPGFGGVHLRRPHAIQNHATYVAREVTHDGERQHGPEGAAIKVVGLVAHRLRNIDDVRRNRFGRVGAHVDALLRQGPFARQQRVHFPL